MRIAHTIVILLALLVEALLGTPTRAGGASDSRSSPTCSKTCRCRQQACCMALPAAPAPEAPPIEGSHRATDESVPTPPPPAEVTQFPTRVTTFPASRPTLRPPAPQLPRFLILCALLL